MLFFIAHIVFSLLIDYSHCDCRLPVLAIRERSGNNVTVECYIFFGGHAPIFCHNDVPVTNSNETDMVYTFMVSKESEGRYKFCCSPQCETCSEIDFFGEIIIIMALA